MNNQILKKKYILNYGGQMKYYKKKPLRQVHKTEDYTDQLPPILAAARINTQLETINIKYRNKPISYYQSSTPQHKNPSLPSIKISPNDSQEQVKSKINSYLLPSNQAKVIVRNDFLKQSMIGYSKISTIMIT